MDYRDIPPAELIKHLACHQQNIRLLAKRCNRQDEVARRRAICTQFNLLSQIFEIEALLDPQEPTA